MDKAYMLKQLLNLLEIPSPTGMAEPAAQYVLKELKALGYTQVERARRGHIRVRVKGKKAGPVRAVCGHLDTLGALVAGIRDDGSLRLTPIGGFDARNAENVRVTIHGDKGDLRATLLTPKSTAHSYTMEELNTQKASWDSMICRVDVVGTSKNELEKAGVKVGHWVSVDTGTEVVNDFVVSRFIDNKGSVAVQLAVLKEWARRKVVPAVTTDFVFTMDEEVGFGGTSMLAKDTADCLILDIAPVSEWTNSCEHEATVALKDGAGFYSHDLSHEVIALADKHKIPLRRDIFRFYMSDGTAAIRAGHDVRVALAGFGTHATHGYERTHLDGLMALAKLVEVWGRS